jgi:hypothetical protein
MDMDGAIKIMGWCVGAFAAVMFGLGHVMTGNGNDGLLAMDAQAMCDRNRKVIGVNINPHTPSAKTYLCRR